MNLRERLTAEIATGGPLTIAQYIGACLHDTDFGYYATRPALGEAGDFVTAPMVSQMYGELIGVWASACWTLMGQPRSFRLVEMGPGDGTLMSDILRAVALAPGFLEAADLWLVETSEPLKAKQRERLGATLRWAPALSDVPCGAPLILIANELLDCLPARQFVRTASGWAEQMVGLDAAGDLAFTLKETPVDALLPDAPPGAVFEQSMAQAALGSALGARLTEDGGAALLVDYGCERPGFGDTLQAVRAHEKVDPLAFPGEADLTVHADFPSVLDSAEAAGAQTAILTQAAFLSRLGIGERAEALVRARKDKAGLIGRQLDRLVGNNQMGTLFKAVCIYSPGWIPPAFEED